MASLFTALNTAGNSLDVLEQAIGVVQNNVTNATTPGYVSQSLTMASRPFDPSSNLWGGVESTGVQSSRDVYAEQSVWSANQQAGFTSQQSASLNQLQQIFDVTGQSGVPAALSSLYSAFSAWSASPSNATAQQGVLTAAKGLASAFKQTSDQAQQISSDTEKQLTASVTQLNQDTAQIAQINQSIRNNPGNDAGLQAQLYNSLQDLSGLAPITVNFESDGTATVLLAGQSPLVQGTTQNLITTTVNPSASPVAQVFSSDGQPITSLIDQGSIGAELDFRNNTMASILGDGSQQGDLNILAENVATQINNLLTAGTVGINTGAPSGVPLFGPITSGSTGVAGNLAVSSTITGAQLAAASVGPPPVANGVANELANMVKPTKTTDMINGLSYSEFYGTIATSVGQKASTASSNDSVNTNLLNQAEALRSQISGVSLNEQATKLLQFQESYQASAQMISTIRSMTQSLLSILQ